MEESKIIFPCPACGIQLSVPMRLAGVVGPCPSCRTSIRAPRLSRPPVAGDSSELGARKGLAPIPPSGQRQFPKLIHEAPPQGHVGPSLQDDEPPVEDELPIGGSLPPLPPLEEEPSELPPAVDELETPVEQEESLEEERQDPVVEQEELPEEKREESAVEPEALPAVDEEVLPVAEESPTPQDREVPAVEQEEAQAEAAPLVQRDLVPVEEESAWSPRGADALPEVVEDEAAPEKEEPPAPESLEVTETQEEAPPALQQEDAPAQEVAAPLEDERTLPDVKDEVPPVAQAQEVQEELPLVQEQGPRLEESARERAEPLPRADELPLADAGAAAAAQGHDTGDLEEEVPARKEQGDLEVHERQPKPRAPEVRVPLLRGKLRYLVAALAALALPWLCVVSGVFERFRPQPDLSRPVGQGVQVRVEPIKPPPPPVPEPPVVVDTPPQPPPPVPEPPVVVEPPVVMFVRPGLALPVGEMERYRDAKPADLLREFLTASSLRERWPMIATLRQPRELMTTCLAGHLPAATAIALEFEDPQADLGYTDYCFAVHFKGADPHQSLQSIWVRQREGQGPKVMADPFVDLQGGGLPAFIAAPVAGERRFQILVAAFAGCSDPEVPDAAGKMTLKLLASSQGEALGRAYFAKAGPIGRLLEGDDFQLSYGNPTACQVRLRWNHEESPGKPYLEAVAIERFGWAP